MDVDVSAMARSAAANSRSALRQMEALAREGQAAQWAYQRLPALLQAPDRRALLAVLVEEARAVSGVSQIWAGIWTGSVREGSLSFQSLEQHNATVPSPERISRTLLGEAIASGRPLWCEDALAEISSESVRMGQVRSVGCLPLGSNGVLYLHDQEKKGLLLDPDVQARLTALAALAAPFLVEREMPAPAAAPEIPGLVAGSRRMRELVGNIRTFADVPWPVLIVGETGTGKELVAGALHQTSSRRSKPFIKVNASAIPDSIFEGELFGYKKGAFTGAIADIPGKFEAANGGTLFLDEIGEMPFHQQAKLLRVLEEYAVTRLGESTPRSLDVRVIAATNRNLHDEIKAGRFREDLYFRLAAGQLRVPPLRERREDIPALAEALLLQAHSQHAWTARAFSPEALRLLAAHDWPGNVRQLRDAIRMGLVYAAQWNDDLIRPEHIAEPTTREPGGPASLGSGEEIPAGLLPATEWFQRGMVRRALQECGENRRKAAEQLGVTRQWLQRLLARWGGTP